MNTKIVNAILNKLYKFFMIYIYIVIVGLFVAILFLLKSHFINIINLLIFLYGVYVYVRWMAMRYTLRMAGATYVYGLLSGISLMLILKLYSYLSGSDTFNPDSPIILMAIIFVTIVWWLGNIFGRVRKRIYYKMLKMKEQLDYETENWEAIVAELARNKRKAFTYWYRKPLLVLKGLTGWPLKIKPPNWMLVVVWAEILGVAIIANCWIRAVVNPRLTDLMLLQSFGTIIVQSVVISIPILLLLLLIMYLRRNQKPSFKQDIDESVEETPLQQYKKLQSRIRGGI